MTDTNDMRRDFEAWEIKLLELVDYNMTTGKLSWKQKPNRNIPIGQLIGKANVWGHLSFGFMGKTLMCHRVIWFLHHKNWPEYQIDHIDGDKSNNRLFNLRDVRQSINMQNQVKAHKSNKSGYLGVHLVSRTDLKNRWKASIKKGGKNISIGFYATPKDAHNAYLEFKSQFHPGFVPSDFAAAIRQGGAT